MQCDCFRVSDLAHGTMVFYDGIKVGKRPSVVPGPLLSPLPPESVNFIILPSFPIKSNSAMASRSTFGFHVETAYHHHNGGWYLPFSRLKAATDKGFKQSLFESRKLSFPKSVSFRAETTCPSPPCIGGPAFDGPVKFHGLAYWFRSHPVFIDPEVASRSPVYPGFSDSCWSLKNAGCRKNRDGPKGVRGGWTSVQDVCWNR